MLWSCNFVSWSSFIFCSSNYKDIVGCGVLKFGLSLSLKFKAFENDVFQFWKYCTCIYRFDLHVCRFLRRDNCTCQQQKTDKFMEVYSEQYMLLKAELCGLYFLVQNCNMHYLGLCLEPLCTILRLPGFIIYGNGA